MSLTSQVKDKNSNIRRFFTKFEDKKGAKECIALLQSTYPIRMPPFTPASPVVYAYIGTTTDYLIRYAANENSLIFEDTVAFQALESCELIQAATGQDFKNHLTHLYAIGKENLNGIAPPYGHRIIYKPPTDPKAVYSATALAVMDNVLRCGLLPKSFSEPITEEKMKVIKKTTGKNPNEKTTRFLFNEYFESLGGDLYAQDVSQILQTFIFATIAEDREIYKPIFTVFNQRLANSRLVGGADFDCIIEYNDRSILTDIKTIIRPISIDNFRQIVSYALLYDEKEDDFEFTDIGIYHARSGSFRFLSLDDVIKKYLPSLESINHARKVFIEEISPRMA